LTERTVRSLTGHLAVIDSVLRRKLAGAYAPATRPPGHPATRPPGHPSQPRRPRARPRPPARHLPDPPPPPLIPTSRPPPFAATTQYRQPRSTGGAVLAAAQYWRPTQYWRRALGGAQYWRPRSIGGALLAARSIGDHASVGGAVLAAAPYYGHGSENRTARGTGKASPKPAPPAIWAVSARHWPRGCTKRRAGARLNVHPRRGSEPEIASGA
jgi:hypothetical protein